MTLPHKEAYAIARTRQFLFDLLDPKATPRVPKAVRKRAHTLSKHYPLLPTVQQAQRMMERMVTK
jgi:hypothetical protein